MSRLWFGIAGWSGITTCFTRLLPFVNAPRKRLSRAFSHTHFPFSIATSHLVTVQSRNETRSCDITGRWVWERARATSHTWGHKSHETWLTTPTLIDTTYIFLPPCQSSSCPPPYMTRVVGRTSAVMTPFSGSVRSSDDAPPASVIAGCAVTLLLPLSGLFRLKEREMLSNTPSDSIQSCQGVSLGTPGARGVKGWNPRTRISWMRNRVANGARRSLMSRAIALPWNT